MKLTRPLLALVSAALLVSAGVAASRWRRAVLEEEAAAYWLRVLEANAGQAARSVRDWLAERGQDAEAAASSAARPIREAGPGGVAPGVADDLRSFVRHEGFRAGWGVSRAGRVVASAASPADTLRAPERDALERAMRSRRSGIAGPWVEPSGVVALTFVAPVVDGGEVVGGVALRTDLRSTLLGAVVWEVQPSRTGQTRLLASRGDSLFVVSPSRHPARGPMELAAARAAAPPLWRAAVEGEARTGTFGDATGPVLAATHPLGLPGWGLARSIAREEALEYTRHDLATEHLLALAVLALVGSAAALARRMWRVAAQRRTHAALHASEARHRMLFERNPLPMWVYDVETLRILEVNGAAVAAYGYTREEFLNLTLADLRAPGEVPALLAVRGVAGSGRREAGTFWHRRKNGSTLAVEIISDDAGDDDRPARLVLAHDVTVREAASRALREAHTMLATVIDSAPLAIVTTDRELRVRDWNPAAERMFGWAAGEVQGEVYPVRAPRGVADPRDITDAVLAHGRSVQRQVQRIRRDGTVVDLLVSAAPLRDAAGEVEGIVSFHLDVSERVHLEEQLRHAQKMEAVGRLAGGVAHDFNNLLTAMKGYGEFIADELPPDSPLRADLNEMLAATDRASALTRQLLVFSRKQVTAPRQVDLNVLIRDLYKMLVRVVGEDILFELDLARAPATVHADPGQIHQVLMNLAVNARDAMPDGGRLRVSTDVVRSDAAVAASGGGVAEAAHGYVRLRVSDSGTGMAPSVLQRAFEPFFTTKEPGKGTGLGLATVYGIVRQCAGWVGVESAPGAGATFTILLPRAPEGEDAAPEPSSAEPAQPRGAATVMVVEDEPSVRGLVHRTLLRHGYRVVVAENGRDALRRDREMEEAIDLLVTDVVMPEMRGTDLADEMVRRHPGLRVLFMSGYPDRGVALDEGLAEGADFLQKPFSPAQLVENVRAVLTRADASRRDGDSADDP